MFYKNSELNFLEILSQKKKKTPVVIYDSSQFKYTIEKIKSFFSVYNFIELSYAVKASYEEFFLENLSDIGFGCDVAGAGEYNLIRDKNFAFVTTTSPHYTDEDMKMFTKENILIDFNSLDQIQQFNKLNLSRNIGLRMRVNLPQDMRGNLGTYSYDSRFGMEFNEELVRYIENNNFCVKRIHTHTGQMTPEILIYKVEYLLKIAEYFKQITHIDLGGGVFHLFKSEEKLDTAMKEIELIIKKFNTKNERDIKLILEPGGALTIPFGYLVTEVVSVQKISEDTILTVDSSAWNIMPWSIYHVQNLSNLDGELEEVKIAGNTLFEGDFFGLEEGVAKKHLVKNVNPGDKLLFFAAGGYTFTNSREFNMIDKPGTIVV